MRPHLSEETVKDLNTVVEQVAHIDPETVGVEQRLSILFANLGTISVKNKLNSDLPAREVRDKYRSG